MERPNLMELDTSLCWMIEEERRQKEKFERECNEKKKFWCSLEKGYREWEEDLGRREKAISDYDEGLEKMVPDLKLGRSRLWRRMWR